MRTGDWEGVRVCPNPIPLAEQVAVLRKSAIDFPDVVEIVKAKL